MKAGTILGTCIACREPIYDSEAYEELDKGYFIHDQCLADGAIDDEPSGGPP